MNDLIHQVRGGDYDRFLTIQRAPAAKRPLLYALVAFHIELARVAEIVSEPLIGHIRFAWWREALQEIEAGKTPRNHPVVLALAQIHRTHPQIFTLLHEIIDARAADLDTSLIAQEAAWLAYCDHTAGALHLAMAHVLDTAAASVHTAAIRTQGQVFAIVGLARAIPFMAAQGWLRFPHARLNAVGLESLEPSPALPQLVKTLVADALGMIPCEALPPCFAPHGALAALTQLYVQQLQRVGDDPYRLRPSRLAAVWCVLMARAKR